MKWEDVLPAVAGVGLNLAWVLSSMAKPPPPPPPPGKAALQVYAYADSEPVIASVEVLGVVTGKTPFYLEVDPGTYTIDATYGDEKKSETVTVEEGQVKTVQFYFTLPIEYNTLTIKATVGGGRYLMEGEPIPPGSYPYPTGTQITVQAEPQIMWAFSHFMLNGVRHDEQIISFVLDRDLTLQAFFVETGMGTLFIRAYVDKVATEGIPVEVVGVGAGETPWQVEVEPGTYEIRATYGTQELSGTREVRPTTVHFVDFYFAGYFTLTIAAEVGGTTNPPPDGYTHTKGTPVYVYAIPNAGWFLSSWTLNGVQLPPDNPVTVIIEKDCTLTAFFSQKTPPITDCFPSEWWYYPCDAPEKCASYYMGSFVESYKGFGIYGPDERGHFNTALCHYKFGWMTADASSIESLKAQIDATTVASPACVLDGEWNYMKKCWLPTQGVLDVHAYADSIEVPAGVEIVGVETGTTPLRVIVIPRTYTVIAQWNEQRQEQTVTVEPGKVITVEFRFVAPECFPAQYQLDSWVSTLIEFYKGFGIYETVGADYWAYWTKVYVPWHVGTPYPLCDTRRKTAYADRDGETERPKALQALRDEIDWLLAFGVEPACASKPCRSAVEYP